MSKGKQLLDEFLRELDKSLSIIREKNTITLDELTPAWRSRERLEAYLDPPRDEKGHWLSQQDTRSTPSPPQSDQEIATPTPSSQAKAKS